MFQLIKKLEKKVNSIMWSFFIWAALFIMFAVIIIKWPIWLNVFVAIFFIFLAGLFFHTALKIKSIKKDIKDHFKL